MILKVPSRLIYPNISLTTAPLPEPSHVNLDLTELVNAVLEGLASSHMQEHG
jgi:hypothetical protein